MADEEPVDPKKYLEESCKPKCVKPLLEYQDLSKRPIDNGQKWYDLYYLDEQSVIRPPNKRPIMS